MLTVILKTKGQRVISFLMQVLEAEESKAVQALICLGLSKLMLFGLVTDERVRYNQEIHERSSLQSLAGPN